MAGVTDRPAGTPVPARFAALRARDYRAYFALGLVAATADNIEHVISYWMMFQKFRSPTLAGFAVISHWVPFLLFSVYDIHWSLALSSAAVVLVSAGLLVREVRSPAVP